jgi:UDP-glucose 4-epimerase
MSELCLVTGGAGFIGSHLVEGLTAHGQRVRVLDDYSTGLRSNLDHIHPWPEVIVGDIADPTTVARATAGANVVYHLAAMASVQKSVEAPSETHRVCDTGTLMVLDAARRANVRRVVYAASASAYGLPSGETQTEADPVHPLSPYAAAKLAGELYMQAFAATYGLETVRLRFFNIFGPRQRADSPYSGVIAIFAGLLTAGRTPTIYGDGLQTRDFTYVSDVVQALLKAASAPNISGHVYNVGSGQKITLLDLVTTLNQLLGSKIKPRHEPERAGDIRHSRADISRTRRDLGYEPKMGFEEGLNQTLQWFREESAPKK